MNNFLISNLFRSSIITLDYNLTDILQNSYKELQSYLILVLRWKKKYIERPICVLLTLPTAYIHPYLLFIVCNKKWQFLWTIRKKIIVIMYQEWRCMMCSWDPSSWRCKQCCLQESRWKSALVNALLSIPKLEILPSLLFCRF